MFLVKLYDDSHVQPAIQELFKDCDFYGMIQDYYKKNPNDAEEIGLRIFQNDRVVDELNE